jgi:hypothetical protein
MSLVFRYVIPNGQFSNHLPSDLKLFSEMRIV